MNKNSFLKKSIATLILPLIFSPVNAFASLPGYGINSGNNNNRPYKINLKKRYGTGIEANLIKKDLGGFDVYHSRAFNAVRNTFGRSVRLNELLGIINSIDVYMQRKGLSGLPRLTRNEKRSFALLIKYIENNYELIVPYFQYITLCDQAGIPIPLDIYP